MGDEREDGCDFKTVLWSMNCLMVNGIFADQAKLLQLMLRENLTCYVAFIWFLIMGTLASLNLLIGVFCEVVETAKEKDEKEQKEVKAQSSIEEILKMVDQDSDDFISKDEFESLLKEKCIHKSLE